MPNFHKLHVKAVEQLTTNAVALSFEVPSEIQEQFTFTAGQYITLSKAIDGEEVRRSYSISSSPSSGKLTVGIKKIPNGVFSTYANDEIAIGDSIEVMPPEGRFVFTLTEASQTVGAFAAGSGITPIMSIAQTVLESNTENTFVLVYGNKTPEDTMYLDALKALQEKYEGRFFIQWVYSRSTAPEALFGRIERSTVNLILKNRFKAYHFDLFYLCGPEAMIDVVSKTLQENDIPEDQILYELFTSSETEDTIAQEVEGKTNVVVLLDDEEHELVMDKKEIVLDAVLQNDIDAPYSCQGGVCSSCIARVTTGKAEMIKNQILTDGEVAEGLILTCQAHPLTSFLKVDFDDV
ncbi:MAG: ferredoxin--NADP reductase [Bacteroidota bacterium]